MRTLSRWLLPAVGLLACALAGVGYAFEVWAGGTVPQQGPPTQEAVQTLVWHLFLQNWWCAFGGLGGLLYGYFRHPFASHKPKHPQWRWLFRMEVAGVATVFTGLLMTAFVDAPSTYTKVVAILCVAPITGMATPPFYDGVWRPFLWPLLKNLARVFAKGAVKSVEATTGEPMDSESTLVKFAKGKEGKDKEK